jgi:hypothetical protein
VLFFDEFDAIGKERGDLHETGEIKRVVTTLLLQLDDLPSYCVLVAATNHPELLDRATWRRFQLRLELDRPGDDDIAAYCTGQLRRLDGTPGYTGGRLAQAIRPNSFSEAEDFFLDVRRRAALAQGSLSLRAILDDRVRACLTLPSAPARTVSIAARAAATSAAAAPTCACRSWRQSARQVLSAALASMAASAAALATSAFFSRGVSPMAASAASAAFTRSRPSPASAASRNGA